MNTATDSFSELDRPGASLWLQQFSAIFAIEFETTLFSKRALAGFVFALIPALLVIIVGFNQYQIGGGLAQIREIFAYIYSVFFLGAVVFLGNAALFTAIFRGEILQRSMHYYLLTPVRRELLVAAKFCSALLAAMTVFGTALVICYSLLYLPFGADRLLNDFNTGIASRQLATYFGITLLASMAYGALFMTTGLLFRSPLIAVVAVASWEAMHFVLPPFLKLFSIVHYLQGLMPIPLDEGPMAIVAVPPPTWVSVTGLIALTLAALSVSIFLLKRLEIRYTEE